MSRIQPLLNAYQEAAQRDKEYWDELIEIVDLVEEQFTSYLTSTPGDPEAEEVAFNGVKTGTPMADGSFDVSKAAFVRDDKTLNFSVRLDLLSNPVLCPRSFAVIDLTVTKPSSGAVITDASTNRQIYVNKDLQALCKWLHERCIEELAHV